jgi:hypothetical protein
MTGGFFLGPATSTSGCARMPPQELAKIDMTRIDFINQLYGGQRRAQARAAPQGALHEHHDDGDAAGRRGASDALESGQVVSGVGGQYNFVAMSHALPDARLHHDAARHARQQGRPASAASSGTTATPPSRATCATSSSPSTAWPTCAGSPTASRQALIAIADSRFQDELVRRPRRTASWTPAGSCPTRWRHNLPEALDARLHPWAEAGLLPDFPFGTDLTDDELHIVKALKKLKHATHHPAELLTLAVRSLWEGKAAPQAYLERLGLADAHSLKDLVVRRLFAGNL